MIRLDDVRSAYERLRSGAWREGAAEAEIQRVADMLDDMAAELSCSREGSQTPDPLRALAAQIACSPMGAHLVVVRQGLGSARVDARETADNAIIIARRILGAP